LAVSNVFKASNIQFISIAWWSIVWQLPRLDLTNLPELSGTTLQVPIPNDGQTRLLLEIIGKIEKHPCSNPDKLSGNAQHVEG
jgi:hypothetical protein